jgi:hypothetical protein
MLVPGLEGILYFLGVNVIEFLEYFKELYNEY